jgi:hypothetical protein
MAGALSLIALTGYWIVLARIIRMPGSVLPSAVMAFKRIGSRRYRIR